MTSDNAALAPFADPHESSVGRGATLYARAVRLRCPHCGGGSLRGGWLRMRRNCAACGLRSERGEEDFFLGAMLFNLVLTEALLVMALVGFVLLRWPHVPWEVLGWVSLGLAVAAPFVFYPFSHTIWLASDILIRPVTAEEMQWHRSHRPDEYRSHRDR